MLWAPARKLLDPQAAPSSHPEAPADTQLTAKDATLDAGTLPTLDVMGGSDSGNGTVAVRDQPWTQEYWFLKALGQDLVE